MPSDRSGAAIQLTPDVRRALDERRPVVALESSVFAQGLPIPANAEAARRMCEAIVETGATPAITAVLRGTATAGLTPDELDLLLRREAVTKASSRDLAVAMATGATASTTVAAALVICDGAGIPVFATGGIGGVHREPEYDESADLVELSRRPVIVVCAGAKSILDLPATIERLETLCVTVLGFGTTEFPGFFFESTGLPVSAVAADSAEVVRVFLEQRRLGMPGALLVVQPPPATHALVRTVVDDATNRALVEARRAGVRGSAMTPFLLAAIERATRGASLETNLALLEANARLAGEIARSLAGMPTQRQPNR